MSSPAPVTLTNGPMDWDDTPYREDYERRYGTEGAGYDVYQPAYRLGHDAVGDARYANRDWADAEADLRGDWEREHPDSPWQHFKDAVKHAWDRIRH